MRQNVAGESFETSCPWSKVLPLIDYVREETFVAGEENGLGRKDMFISFRVTQLYNTGAAVYVYLGINFINTPESKMVEIYEDIENKARNATMKMGGSISHHHGVGKLRKRFME